MCGIFGIALRKNANLDRTIIKKILCRLYALSESRGKESAGIHFYLPDKAKAYTTKIRLSSKGALHNLEFRKSLDLMVSEAENPAIGRIENPVIAIGHSRMATNGTNTRDNNNQPIQYGSIALVHNGIIVNDDDIWNMFPLGNRLAEVDSEVIAAMLNYVSQNQSHVSENIAEVYKTIEGSASIAWTNDRTGVLALATNTGDIYYSMQQGGEGIIFASEKFTLEGVIDEFAMIKSEFSDPVNLASGFFIGFDTCGIDSVQPMSFENPKRDGGSFGLPPRPMPVKHSSKYITVPAAPEVVVPRLDESALVYDEVRIRGLRRCSRCVLPETFPFIAFDKNGVCNFCLNYAKNYPKLDRETAIAEFEQMIDGYRSRDGSPDVLVPLSGGRDSCYGLHLIKKELGLNPITFTYDWGMITDLARRNIARICGRLGVQNILVSADIRKKRDYIRKNISAWMKRPDLGIVPLFMAGDKHFFSIIRMLQRQTNIRLNIWSSNPFENTDFKSGLCGVSPDFDKPRFDYLTIGRNARMIAHYLKQFAINPAYINESLGDTISAFFSYYVRRRSDYFWIFKTVPWMEEEVNSLIQGEYDFESAADSDSTWRIGDGTAGFYNYIYVTSLGFSEFDTFRSNQIREGMMTRNIALEKIIRENRPRIESLNWYFNVIGLDGNSVIRKINELQPQQLR